MKAAAYTRTGGPEVLEYVDVPDPELRPGGVIIGVEAVGVQGGDLLHRAGGVMVSPRMSSATRLPDGFATSAPVSTSSSSASPSWRRSATAATPSWCRRRQGLCTPSLRGCRSTPPPVCRSSSAPPTTACSSSVTWGAGEAVLVQAGAGGVGLAAIQLAKAAAAGAVIATASSDDRLERLGEHGMDHGINYTRDDVAARVRELTDGQGVDLVVDPVGGRTLEASIASLAYRGRVSWVGRAGREVAPPEVWPLMEKNATLTGVFLGAEMARSPARVRAMIERLLQRVASGELSVVIDRVFPLAEAAAAHVYIESRRAFGRVLLRP